MRHDEAPKPMLIDGRQVGTANEPLVSVNPSTGTINHAIAAAGPDEVDLAVQTSARAMAHPDWRDLQPHHRAAILQRIGDLMQRDADLLAHLQMIENGKVRSECAAQVRVDFPDAAGARMGPIASFAHRDHIARVVDAAREAGARVLTGGAAPADPRLAQGAFYLPTIIGGVDNEAAIAQQEIFGPVLCVLPFDDEDEVILDAVRRFQAKRLRPGKRRHRHAPVPANQSPLLRSRYAMTAATRT